MGTSLLGQQKPLRVGGHQEVCKKGQIFWSPFLWFVCWPISGKPCDLDWPGAPVPVGQHFWSHKCSKASFISMDFLGRVFVLVNKSYLKYTILPSVVSIHGTVVTGSKRAGRYWPVFSPPDGCLSLTYSSVLEGQALRPVSLGSPSPPPRMSSVMLDKWVPFSWPSVPQLYYHYPHRLIWGLNELMLVTHLKQRPAWNKHHVNAPSIYQMHQERWFPACGLSDSPWFIFFFSFLLICWVVTAGPAYDHQNTAKKGDFGPLYQLF